MLTMRLSLLLSTVVLPVTLLAAPQPVTNPLVDIEATAAPVTRAPFATTTTTNAST
jgi:hypothetical protein